MRILTLLALLLAAPMLPVPAAAQQPSPSFDCAEATTPDEETICESIELAELDRLVSDAYADFEPEFGDRTAIARDVLRDRKACARSAACIAAVYAGALRTYAPGRVPLWPSAYAEGLMLRKAEAAAANGGANAALPRQVGECASTTIGALTDRFGTPLQDADFTAGSRVEFANGAAQVSYAREDALVVSEVGDDVTICLFDRPRDCPAGDDRGSTYLTVNENRGVYWLLTDAQHICGGA